MQRSTNQLVMPALLNGAAVALLLATFVSSGFLPGVWTRPPHSFHVPTVPTEQATEPGASEVAPSEATPGEDDSDPDAPSPPAPGSVPADDSLEAPDEPSADSFPGQAPEPAPDAAPAPVVNEPAAATNQLGNIPSPEPSSGRIDAPTAEGLCAFRVNDIEIGRAVRRRRVARVEQPFVSNGLPVFAWVDLHNRDESITLARVRWTHLSTGHSMESEIEMRVGNHWQVVVEQRLPATLLGAWRIDVVDPADCAVMSRQFEMTAIGWELED